jgi:hypothetical protein
VLLRLARAAVGGSHARGRVLFDARVRSLVRVDRVEVLLRQSAHGARLEPLREVIAFNDAHQAVLGGEAAQKQLGNGVVSLGGHAS